MGGKCKFPKSVAYDMLLVWTAVVQILCTDEPAARENVFFHVLVAASSYAFVAAWSYSSWLELHCSIQLLSPTC